MRLASLRLIGLFASVVWARDVGAQEASDTVAARSRAEPPLVALWGSAGLGSGQVHGSREGAIAGVVRANVSVGRWIVSYRETDVDPITRRGEGVRDHTILAGMRTGNHRVFVSGALGYSDATHYVPPGQNFPEVVDPSAGALAYDYALHANYWVLGVGLAFSGNLGRTRVSYSAVTLMIEAGGFGR